ncbi:hypothetical protein [Nocardia jejuensis]|uniref:hypothetical protein n=1 Tax=Nocardia jejuensis TaxID=328049 RepID=UPI0012F98B83|nr:hypothetical protein [Nocardia jejuensis]
MSITHTLSRIYLAPANAKTTAAPGKSNRPPCAEDPSAWDLDVGTPESWRIAVEICQHCPLLIQCRGRAENFIARGDAPRAMIWAGVGYDNAGKIVENLDRHRIAPVDRNRPMRIIRTSADPNRAEPALRAPRRHLVLGQPLRPTGTD